MMCKFVSFFGSIGVGKTTVGKMIAKKFPEFGFVEEDLDDNPYLERAYDDMHKWGFLSSLEMLRMMSLQFDRFEKNYEIGILDNGIEELICYARLQRKMGILSAEEFDTYQRLNRRFLEITPEISLYIYFYCSEDVQISRIASRGRSYENDIKPSFIRNLNKEYEIYVASLPKDRLLTVNTDHFSDCSNLAQNIKKKLWSL